MINAEGLIIGTPARCGTYSMESIARKMGWECIRPGLHRMIPPEEYKLYPRYLQVRDPYERMESIYHYLHDPQNYSQWGARSVQGMTFKRFITWYAAARVRLIPDHPRDANTFRSPHLWLLSLSENADLLDMSGIAGVVRLESLIDDLFKATQAMDLPNMPHRHARRNLVRSDWDKDMLRLAEWCKIDALTFGYPVRK